MPEGERTSQNPLAFYLNKDGRFKTRHISNSYI